MKTVSVFGRPSWRLASDRVEAFLTRQAGHLALVKFRLPGRRQPVQPYAVAPWALEKLPASEPPVTRVPADDGEAVTLICGRGRRVTAAVDSRFLHQRA